MKDVNFSSNLKSVTGEWQKFDEINVWNVRKKEIYRSALEPGFVCWAILWKESDGTLKLSFTEASGDICLWPPVYNFNSPGIDYYLKTLVSHDGGESWVDTGWREDLDSRWEINPDHHIRHVFQMHDGTLLRNYCHTVDGITEIHALDVYDESKAMQDFPFSAKRPFEFHPKFSSTWKSMDGGKTWEEIHIRLIKPPFFVTGIHQLKNGSVVATGAVTNEYAKYETWQVAITESRDGGRTWSDPNVIAENDDILIPQVMGEESDFVELSDGRLLLVLRTDGAGMNMIQMYLSRDKSGKWHATKPSTNPLFVPSGYPYMHKASDGTIFYYSHMAILYSCDEGVTWHPLPLGVSYYGQLVETSPGHIVAVTQRNIGDKPYPWKYDTSMLQTTFNYRRTGVVEQTISDIPGAIAVIDEGVHKDFHICAEIRIDGEAGLAFNVDDNTYGFAAVVVPCNEFRAPGRAAGKEQDAVLIIGRSHSGVVTVMRRMWVGKIVTGSWIEMQLDMSAGVLKVAVKTPYSFKEIIGGDYRAGNFPATYVVLRDDFGGAGKLGLFTNGSTGAFKNVRIDRGGTEIRSNWRLFAGGD